MGKRSINSQIYKTLLARSGNKCAFPGCNNALFNQKYEFIAQLCHIEGVKGERYNSNLNDEQINSYSNIMFLCYEHHTETNNEKKFTVDVLKKMKNEHEGKYILSPYVANMSQIFSLRKETEEYWDKVEIANKTENIVPDFKVYINSKADYDELNLQLISELNSISKFTETLKKYDKQKYFEILNIGIPNSLTKSFVILEQMQIKFYEEHIGNYPNDNKIKFKLENLRTEFIENSAKSAGIVD